jgi:hypothetical protein
MMDKMARQPSIPFAEYMSMVAFMFLFAPAVVLVAVWIMQWFQPRRDLDPAALHARVVEGGRIEPRFSAVNDNAEHELEPRILTDQHSISAG